jgi:hypothetical protein
MMMDPALMGGVPPMPPTPMDPAMMGSAPPMPPDPMMDPMGGGFGMGMMDPMLPDPLAMAEPIPDYDIGEPDETYGPTPPSWYRKPSKPKLAEVLEDAERERARHEGRIALAMETLSRLNLEGFGMFERDKEKIKSGEIEGWIDTSMRDEHDAACSHISRMDWSAESLFRQPMDAEEADAKEDLVHYIWECWQRQHSEAGNSHLRISLPDILMKYGMLVTFASIDPGDEECGLRVRMIDPATVYPVHEGHRGIGAVYRVYNATAAQVIGDFGDPEGKVERKVRKIVGQSDGNEGTFDRNWEGEVTEYWDRNWVLVAFEDEQILVREHGYARVPFVITYGGFGQQAFTSSRDTWVHGEGETWNRPGYGVQGLNFRERDMMRIAQPYWARRFRQHDIGEALGGRLLTSFRRSMKPPVMIKQSIMSGEMNDIEVDWNEEGQTKLGADDDIVELPTLPQPEIMQPLMAMIDQGKQTSMATGIMMGQSPHSQASGSAIDILAQSGYDKWAPIVLGIQSHLSALAEYWLSLYRDWGLLLGMEPNIGTMYIPRRNSNPRAGGSPVHEVTPDLIRRTGIRTVVTLYKFNPANLAALAQGLAVLKSMGIMPKLDAIKIVAFSPDPQGVLRRIDEEALNDVPEVKQEYTLRALVKQAEDARIRGDHQSSEDLLAKAIFIASMMQRTQQIGQIGAGGAGGAPPPMPPTLPPGTPPVDLGRDPSTGQPIPPPAPGVPVGNAIPEMAVGGLPMPQMGIPVGTNGGRPSGS